MTRIPNSRTARPRRRSLLRLLVGIPLTGTLIAGLLTVGWLALGQPTVAQGALWFQVTKLGTSDYYPAPDKPFFFLAVGNDNRDSCTDFKGLADAIHVIGVDPVSHKATIMNVPRDTEAPPGDKINAYYSFGGLTGIATQLNAMMGIQIQYAVTTNFCQFKAMVDEIGGVDVKVTVPMHDTDSGSHWDPGTVHLNGEDALAFSRDRHSLLAGDIDRSANQTVVILAALSKLRAQATDDAGTIKLVATVARHVQTNGFSLTDMFRLGRFGLSLDPANVRSVTVPTGSSGTSSNLLLTSAAKSLFADFADDGVLQTH